MGFYQYFTPKAFLEPPRRGPVPSATAFISGGGTGQPGGHTAGRVCEGLAEEVPLGRGVLASGHGGVSLSPGKTRRGRGGRGTHPTEPPGGLGCTSGGEPEFLEVQDREEEQEEAAAALWGRERKHPQVPRPVMCQARSQQRGQPEVSPILQEGKLRPGGMNASGCTV